MTETISRIEKAKDLLDDIPGFENAVINTDEDVRFHMSELNNYLERESFKYHTLSRPEISDDLYDRLYIRLELLEDIYPEFKIKNGVTSKVGGDVLPHLEKATHSIPLLSLKKAYTEEEVIETFLSEITDVKVQVELIANGKLDGLALEIIYRDGELVQAITRGDGITGEDVTEAVRTIRNVPKVVTRAGKGVFEVRGEVVLPKDAFEALNKKLKEEGKEPYANSRNAVSGILRQLDISEVANKPLAFFSYGTGLWENEGFQLKTLSGRLNFLAHCGFSHKRYHLLTLGSAGPEENKKRIKEWVKEVVDKFTDLRPKYDIDIDGIVFAFNDFNKRQELGSTSSYPRHSVAYKFQASSAVSSLLNVEWQVGRTGVLTPVAHISPVQIHGVTISRVTLHNPSEIQRLDLRIGDKVEVSRQGDVIPKITAVLHQFRKPDETDEIILPSECPVCSSDTVMNDAGNFIYCTGNNVCGGRLITSIEHFASREAMDIRGLGPGIIRLLVEKSYLSNIADIYRLWEFKDKLYEIEGLGKTSVDKLLDEIEKSTTVTLDRFIYAIGINGVGLGTAKRLAKHFDYSFEELRGASPSELESIEDIGEITAELIYLYFQNHTNLNIIHDMVSQGLGFVQPFEKEEDVPQFLAGQSWAVTGSFNISSRKDWEDIIQEHGGKIASSVTKNTTALLIESLESGGGSKLNKALELGIPIILEREFAEKWVKANEEKSETIDFNPTLTETSKSYS